eukprot:SAG11_NODE_1097_length_5882_cov_3.116376_2_plen_106_part_00
MAKLHITVRLHRAIKKDSGYYALSIEQMIEIAKGEEDAIEATKNPQRQEGPAQRKFTRNFALRDRSMATPSRGPKAKTNRRGKVANNSLATNMSVNYSREHRQEK